MKRLIKVFLWLAFLGLAGFGVFWYLRRTSRQPVAYRTAAVKRGDLLATIGATGTVEPEEVVDVGAQVAGQILSFGKDKNGKTVDYGSVVEEGTVLAQIDDTLYAADVASAKAQVQQAEGLAQHASAEVATSEAAVQTSEAAVQASEAGVQTSEAAVQVAEAGVAKAEADLKQMQAKLVQAKNDWDRAQKLGPSEALAQSIYDAYQAAYETAKANVAVGEAGILQAKATVLQSKSTVAQSGSAVAQAKGAVAQAKGQVAQAKSSVEQTKGQVAQAKAALDRANRNLSYCTIKSPVKGVIVDRRVNIGQTVVSAFNVASLFLIARDLKRMEVWVSVNEADIGNIHTGQNVTFTVDAYPGRVFKGTVGTIRLNATMTQNVVTYTVEVVTDNADGRLFPYLTANAQFELGRRTGVLLVPNAALRWFPSQPEQVAPEFRDAFKASSRRGSGAGGEGKAANPPTSTAQPAPRGEPKSVPPSSAQAGSRGETKAWAPPAIAQEGRESSRKGTLWVRQEDGLRPIRARVGLSDGTMTEVEGDDVADGMDVVVGEERQAAGAAGTTSPFTPQMFGQKGK